MNLFTADLHIHTTLSPCALDEMSPLAIVSTAIEQGLDIIAVCDHNSARNTEAVLRAAEHAGQGRLTVIAGIEITTCEEVHVLGLFPDAGRAQEIGAAVAETLPNLLDGTKRYGEQYLIDSEGHILGTESKMLAMASGFSLSETVNLIRRNEGLAIASHVDRPSFSVMSQLGLFPTDVRFDAIEISAAGVSECRYEEFVSLGLPMVTSSDSHFLSDIGICRTVFELVEPSFDEIALAFRNAEGRACRLA